MNQLIHLRSGGSGNSMSKIPSNRYFTRKGGNRFIKKKGVIYCVCQACLKKTVAKHWKGTKYCSRRCVNYVLYFGKTVTKTRYTRGWYAVRKKVLERDSHKCVVCHQKAVQVHHVLPVCNFPELVLETTNLLSLCKKCHHKEHPDLPAKMFE